MSAYGWDQSRLARLADLALTSALFFIITAATFSSLGMVLPAMVAELRLELDQRGLRFHPAGIFLRHHQRGAGQPDPPLRRARRPAVGIAW